MATAYVTSEPDQYATVEITDIRLKTRPHLPASISFDSDSGAPASAANRSQRNQLKVVDELFGPIAIGNYSISRRALDSLGATSNGERLNGQNTFFRHARRSFINSIQLDPLQVEARMRTCTTGDDYSLPSLLFEMASRRPLTAPPLLNDVSTSLADSEKYQRKLDKLLKSAQKLDVHRNHMPKHTPHWISRVKSSSMLGVGVGLQAFGIYSGLRGLQDAVARKDEGEIIFNSLSIGGEITSLGVEVAVTKQAKYMINAGQKAYSDFARTSMGVRLARGGGLIAAAVTLPFDIISAVKSFNNAANTTAKEAMDHYVSGGMSVASAVMSIVLGVAALAGFSMAGPVGLAAGLLLVAGSQVYAAVRVVDEIDDYIELSTQERLRTGWFTFWGISPDVSIEDRLAIAKATAAHSRLLQATARELLEGKLKDRMEVIVNGKFDVELKPTQVRYYDWGAQQDGHRIEKKPQILDGDDNIDARYGVPVDTPGATFGTEGLAKGVAWFIGGGNDNVRGVKNRPNSFYFGAGNKQLEGGIKDDVFIFESASNTPPQNYARSPGSTLKGGEGNDTLVLSGKLGQSEQQHPGYLIDLENETLETMPSTQQRGRILASLESIESVETLAGTRSRVIGSEDANTLVSHGNDHLQAGAGDDQISMLSGNGIADGGAGEDRYFIAHKPGKVIVVEDGLEGSVIVLGWKLGLIDNWRIVANDLEITTKFETDDHLRHKLVIEEIYKNQGAERRLHNRLLTFITDDGFHLVPDCPETIKDGFPLYIDAIITQPGKVKQPRIINIAAIDVTAEGNKQYFVAAHRARTTLNIKTENETALGTVYIDLASTDLTSVETHYSMGLQVQAHKENPLYKSCSLYLNFGNKCVVIANLASSHDAGHVLLTGKRTRPTLELNHQFIVIMNDGVSWRLRPHALADSTIAQMNQFGHVEETTPAAIFLRSGRYDFIQPEENEGYALGASDKCVNLTPPHEQTAIEVLEGAGARYLIHLSAGMTLRITTPGAYASASARSPCASTWELDATQLGAVAVNLANNQLVIGSTTIQLPRYDSPNDLIDPIRVIAADGIVYVVDLAFDALYVDELDGRYFNAQPSSEAVLLNELVANNKTAISVRNIAMKDGTAGSLSYNPFERRWILDTDKSRLINHMDLRQLNRCAHQAEHCYALIKSTVITEPATSAADLELQLHTCLLK
ncbi:calcium-binding protein [Pseudomonas sp. LB3P31]